MLSKIIFCTAICLAILAVVLLALLSPAGRKNLRRTPTRRQPWLALSLYAQQPQVSISNIPRRQVAAPPSDAGALIFRRSLTEGPKNTSRAVGQARGFIIPTEHFANSAFNIIYLSFDTLEYSGSVSIEAKNLAGKDEDELAVVGGTGSFAFARGLAVFARTHEPGHILAPTYHIKLHLKFPNRSQTIPP